MVSTFFCNTSRKKEYLLFLSHLNPVLLNINNLSTQNNYLLLMFKRNI